MALLIPGLAVMAVIDANDREIGRVHYRDGGEGTNIHQQFAVTGHDQDPLVGTGERKAEPDHASAAHRVGVRSILRQRRDIAARAGKPADDQKIVVAADQGRDRIAPVEDEIRSDSGRHFLASIAVHRHRSPPGRRGGQNCFAPRRFWVSSTATALPLWNTIVSAALTVGTTSSGRSIRRQMTPIAARTGSTA